MPKSRKIFDRWGCETNEPLDPKVEQEITEYERRQAAIELQNSINLQTNEVIRQNGVLFRRHASNLFTHADALRSEKARADAAEALAAKLDRVANMDRALLIRAKLSVRQQDVLVAMLEMQAFDSDSRKTTAEISKRSEGLGSDPELFKGAIADLVAKKLLETKRGRGGGCWLSQAGRERSEYLNKR